MSSESKSSGGIGVLGLLGVVFVTLKLCGVINWSWWWVTAPFWGVFALLGLMAVVLLPMAYAYDVRQNRKQRRQLSSTEYRQALEGYKGPPAGVVKPSRLPDPPPASK